MNSRSNSLVTVVAMDSRSQPVSSALDPLRPKGFPILAWAHVRDLWGPYWWIVPLLPAVYAVVLFAIGDLRWEHAVIIMVVATLGFGTRTTKSFFVLTVPFLLTAWGDDAIRYLIPTFVKSDRVLGCTMRNAELALFSVGPNQTLSDYFAVHHAPVFDVLAAVPYAIFWMFPLVYAGYLFYADRPRLSFYLWSLFLAQAVVWFMWLAFPAAPPWYVRAHGCTVDASTAPSAAALLRVDDLFGFHYFQSFYSRGMTTFGALPSGHCVFPMIGLLTAWRFATWRTWPLHLGYTLSMIVASTYLDHHWLIDGLAAWLVSAAAVAVVAMVLRRLGRSLSATEGTVEKGSRDVLVERLAVTAATWGDNDGAGDFLRICVCAVCRHVR